MELEVEFVFLRGRFRYSAVFLLFEDENGRGGVERGRGCSISLGLCRVSLALKLYRVAIVLIALQHMLCLG